MNSCFALHDTISTLNKSWICLANNNTANVSSDENGEECFFLYHQQFNQGEWFCGYLQAAISISLSICIYPCNMIALYNFKKRAVSQEFFLLITTLAICNFLYAICGLLVGITRASYDMPLGKVGCIITMTGMSGLLTLCMWIFALISLEQRVNVLSLSPHSGSTSGPSRFTPRFYYHLATLISITAAFVVINAYQFQMSDAVTTLDAYVDGVKGGIEPVNLCVMIESRQPIQNEIFHTYYGVMTFWAPLIIMATNYCSIWRFVRKAYANAHLVPNNNATEKHRHLEVQHLMNRAHIRRREIFLARLMVASIAQYIILILPMMVALGYVLYDAKHGKKSFSTGMYLAIDLAIFGCAVNPLWSSFVRYNASRGTYVHDLSPKDDSPWKKPCERTGEELHTMSSTEQAAPILDTSSA